MKEKTSDRKTESKRLALTVSDYERSSEVMRALASPDRLKIVTLLGAGSMNVQQIAAAASLPLSTAAAHIRLLEDAGIIMSESVPGVRGSMKLCSRRLDDVSIRLVTEVHSDVSAISLRMPLGGYSRVIDVVPTCGLVTDAAIIGEYDNPSAFYLPDRFDAQLLWFRSGFVEYRFSTLSMKQLNVRYLELSFEACSEAPMYRNPWKSDISIYLNDVLAGVWVSPADLGGRKGLLNPSWWSDVMTQYGYLCTLRMDQNETHINDARVSSVGIADLHMDKHDCLTLRIGVDKQAEHMGGMNLFGERFGDYPQALMLKVAYSVD